MTIAETIGKKIYHLRTQAGLSQQQLADRLFISRKAIGNWENGLRTPDLASLVRVADSLNVTLNELLDGIGPSDNCTSPEPFIIVTEDEPVLLDGIVNTLSEFLPGAKVAGFRNTADTIDFAKDHSVYVAFVDIELDGESGMELARKLVGVNPLMNIIFLTGHPEYMEEAWHLHASGYVLKPLTPKKLRHELSNLRNPVYNLEDLY